MKDTKYTSVMSFMITCWLERSMFFHVIQYGYQRCRGRRVSFSWLAARVVILTVENLRNGRLFVSVGVTCVRRRVRTWIIFFFIVG